MRESIICQEGGRTVCIPRDLLKEVPAVDVVRVYALSKNTIGISFYPEKVGAEGETLKQIEEAESGAEIAYHKATLRRRSV